MVMTEKMAMHILYSANDKTRFDVFIAISELLKGAAYWRCLSFAYTGTDAPIDGVVAAFLFNSNESGRRFLMDKDEHKLLNSLPDKLTIYRGMSETEYNGGCFGISWTLEKEVAEFFANKYKKHRGHEKGVVCSREIRRDEIAALFLERDEFEVIYLHNAAVSEK